MGHMKDLDRRIRQGGDDAIAAACELAGIAKERLRLSANGDCPKPDNATNRDTLTVAEREAVEGAIEAEHRRGAWKWAETLRGLLERMLDTPAANATPSEGIEQSGCTLTAEEREAVEWCVEMALNSATDCVAEINTLRFLLERL